MGVSIVAMILASGLILLAAIVWQFTTKVENPRKSELNDVTKRISSLIFWALIIAALASVVFFS